MDRVEQLQPYEVEPNPIYATGKQKRRYPKDCYRKAYQYVQDKHDLPGVTLVHGFCTMSVLDAEYIHAWVEIPGEIVFDGTTQRFYTKEGYYEAMKAEKIREFTPEEAAEQLTKCGNYGLDISNMEIELNKRVWQKYGPKEGE